jgi:hypothetical protein
MNARSWESDGRGRLDVWPASDFQLEVEWTDGPLGVERWEGCRAELSAILAARTFVRADDWWEARNGGYLRGVEPGSGRLLAPRGNLPPQALEALGKAGVEPLGPVWTGGEERIPGECAAHKALDLVGDIACAIGYLPPLRIVARDAGHALHAQLGRALREAHQEN